ncbi:MAG TPA: hypothetical protein VF529_21960 [Solirubrobacteraceae bacterium]
MPALEPFRRILPALALLAVAAPPAAATPDSYRLWNHPYRKQERCVRLKSSTADPPTRFLNFATTGYNIPNPSFFDPSTDDLICPSGQNYVRIDATERLQTTAPDGSRPHLYFHKGGYGERVPYGHIWLGDLVDADTDPPVLSKSTIDTRGADPVKPDASADSTGYGAGRRCTRDYSPLKQYVVTSATGPPNEVGDTWVYSKDTGRGASYAKYANAGILQGDKDVDYQYLQWSWVGKRYWKDGKLLVANRLGGGETQGYGAVRTILKPGTVVTRCDVYGITSRAWQADTDSVVGRVTAVYVRVKVGDNTVYGWLEHSWQRRYPGADIHEDSSYGPRQCVLAPANDPTACETSSSAVLSPATNDVGCCLYPDQTMFPDDYIVSDDGRFRLVMQLDGNLVEYGPNGAVWASGTYSPGARAVMQLDGNLVIYASGGGAIWSTHTFAGDSTLVVQNDGNLVIYGPNGPVWSRW